MQIRAAVPADIPQLIALAQQADTAPHWSAREYEALFAPHAPERITLVAEQQPSGVAGFVIVRCADEEWEIENVVVDSQLRRQGIARTLLEGLLRQARSRGVAQVLLEVRESNVAARRLYRKMGFTEAGLRPGYYSNPNEDAVLLRTWL
jgi:ribosomal-protein-alanine N-acetyltransferase